MTVETDFLGQELVYTTCKKCRREFLQMLMANDIYCARCQNEIDGIVVDDETNEDK